MGLAGLLGLRRWSRSRRRLFDRGRRGGCGRALNGDFAANRTASAHRAALRTAARAGTATARRATTGCAVKFLLAVAVPDVRTAAWRAVAAGRTEGSVGRSAARRRGIGREGRVVGHERRSHRSRPLGKGGAAQSANDNYNKNPSQRWHGVLLWFPTPPENCPGRTRASAWPWWVETSIHVTRGLTPRRPSRYLSSASVRPSKTCP